jgi:hypothetical protein
MYGDQFGGLSFTAIYKREQDKLANQFIVDAAQTDPILPGQPVMLTPGGTIKAYAPTGGVFLGINLLDGAVANALTTVSILVSHVMIYAIAGEALNAGDGVLVSLVKANTAKDGSDILAYNHMGINKAAAGAAVAIAMEKAEANQTEVRVLVLDAPITVA